MYVLIDDTYSWKTYNVSGFTVYSVGGGNDLLNIVNSISILMSDYSRLKLEHILSIMNYPGAFIMESTKYVIASVDAIGSYPIFFHTSKKKFIVSNSARQLQKNMELYDWHKLSVRELAMAGYVTGADTVIRGISQLQSGGWLLFDKRESLFEQGRFYTYKPIPEEGISDEEWVDQLDSVMCNIARRMIDRLDDREVVLTLSSGLDSRLLACKLHEAGYAKLRTVTYGPPNNWEAIGAQEVAKRLGVPWEFIGVSRESAGDIFRSDDRKNYSKFADGLFSQAMFQEYIAMYQLNQMGVDRDATVLLNGQSGDFISGAHVQKHFFSEGANLQTIVDYIINKHYSLWGSLKTTEFCTHMRDKVGGIIGVDKDVSLSGSQLASLYEFWEFQERQSKWVIHGMRAHDYFGFCWQLPLWDMELVKFFARVPYRLKIEQRLYRLWLEKWNYYGLFRDFKPMVWKWPSTSIAVLPAAQIVGLLLGTEKKESFYNLFKYWGHSSERYAQYTYAEYFKVRNDIRNVLALNMRTWCQENNVPLDVVNIGQ